jgi:8-oxo-dGTP pyrophosphatase MutT (NUDIX family)
MMKENQKRGEKALEILELYTPEGQPTGQRIIRGESIPAGTGILVVGIWAVDEQRRLLLTRRDKRKHSYPDCWENPGGAVKAGETSRDAAARELAEETGIHLSPSKLESLNRCWASPMLVDTYVAYVRAPKIHLQAGETSQYAWVTMEELLKACATGYIAEPIARQIEQYASSLRAMVERAGKNR